MPFCSSPSIKGENSERTTEDLGDHHEEMLANWSFQATDEGIWVTRGREPSHE